MKNTIFHPKQKTRISSSLFYKQYISKRFCCTLRDTQFVFYTVFASIYIAKRHDIEGIYIYSIKNKFPDKQLANYFYYI